MQYMRVVAIVCGLLNLAENSNTQLDSLENFYARFDHQCMVAGSFPIGSALKLMIDNCG